MNSSSDAHFAVACAHAQHPRQGSNQQRAQRSPALAAARQDLGDDSLITLVLRD